MNTSGMASQRHGGYPQTRMCELDEMGRLHYTRFDSGSPEFIRYLDEMPGIPLQDVWTDIAPNNSQAKERMGCATQKPLALLERIIKASSNEVDVVLDPFCGYATTLEAAHNLNRRWIGIDIAIHAIKRVTKIRLQDRLGWEEGRELQHCPAFAPFCQLRVTAAHRLARLTQLGIRQALCFGPTKTKCQLNLTATVANLTLVASPGLHDLLQHGARAAPRDHHLTRVFRTNAQ